MTKIAIVVYLCAVVGFAGCASKGVEVHGFLSWGSMRDVLRDGHTEGRVALADVAQGGVIGVGAMEGLAGEVTIDDGVLHIVTVENGDAVTRAAKPADRATLLAVARVSAWSEHELPSIEDQRSLEDAIRRVAVEAGLDPAAGPIAVRIEGRLREVAMHVVAGNCPHANPDGPQPWRFRGADVDGVVVGFYVEGLGGVLTHHGQRSHLHAIVKTAEGREVSGHLDSIALGAGMQVAIGVDSVVSATDRFERGPRS